MTKFYRFKELDLIIAEPEIASDKTDFIIFNKGDKVKLDPDEIKGSGFEEEVDLNKIFTIICTKEYASTPQTKYQVLFLDSKVTETEDKTGWCNSWFIPA